MGTMKAFATLCLVVAAGSLGLAAAGDGSPGSAGARAVKVARTYVEAYNRRDGKAICAASTVELRRWFVRALDGRLGCRRASAVAIGYGEESDTPTLKRLELLGVHPHVTAAGVRVEVKARYHYKASPKPITTVIKDELYLVQQNGRWRLAKPGGIYFFTRSAYSPPESMLDPPITNAEAHRAAPQPPASFACAAATSAFSDARGDAPASLDVRRVEAGVNADGSVCLSFTFSAPPRPGTDLELQFEQRQNGHVWLTEASVRIGSHGRFYFTLGHGRSVTSPRFRAGWKNGRLEVLWLAQKGPLDGHHPFRYGGSTKSFQAWEPLIRHPLVVRGDDPAGSADGFGAPLG
jgi:hypothetical protein